MRKIVIYPAEILRTVCQPVALGSPSTGDLVKELKSVLDSTDTGIGLAAPQIGEAKRVFLIRTKSLKLVALNPRITWSSTFRTSMEEGCLSLPDKLVIISRPDMVKLEFFTDEGRRREILLSGLNAKVAQHELDHLDGKLIIDHEIVSTITEKG